jgi:ubiquinone/menaquinone biosynthesis C-methylase UbiE
MENYMSDTFTKADWKNYAACYDALNELRPYAEMLGHVLSTLGNARYPLLDAGCGTGNLIARIPPEGRGRIVGIDASMEMLARASVKCAHAEFWLSDLDSTLPFEDSSFGTIVCVNAVYAVADPAKTLAEFNRVLRPAGSLIIVTPKFGYENGLILKAHCGSGKDDMYWQNIHKDPEREELLVHEAINDETLAQRFLQIAKINKVIACERSFHFFTEKTLSRFASQNGFTDIEVKKIYADQNLLLSAKRAQERKCE